MNKSIEQLLSTGHGKEGDGSRVCGLKDLCDVVKNIFAVGTLSLSCMLLALSPILTPEVNAIVKLFWIGIVGALLLTPFVLLLFYQLYFVVDCMPFSFGSNPSKQKLISAAFSLTVLLGISFGLLSMFFIALQSIQKGVSL